MSTDFMSGSTTVSDHNLTMAIPGDVASVRDRLVDAVQQLGYKVMGEQPIYAKRNARASARWDCSLNSLDYPTTLNIALKQTNDVSVVATFNYEIKNCLGLTKGDRQTLAREAEAIAALAIERHAVSACRACGTQITDESHFCRRCGAPLVLDVPELEILRLTRSARGSHHHVVIGLFAVVIGLALIMTLFLTMGLRITPGFWIGFCFATYGIVSLIQGTWQLHFALNPKTPTKSLTAPAQPAFRSSVTTALPPASGRVSVTEGTTELLRRREHDTAEIDTDQLM